MAALAIAGTIAEMRDDKIEEFASCLIRATKNVFNPERKANTAASAT